MLETQVNTLASKNFMQFPEGLLFTLLILRKFEFMEKAGDFNYVSASC